MDEIKETHRRWNMFECGGAQKKSTKCTSEGRQ